MTPDSRHKLKQMLLRDEKYSQFAYTDTNGNITVGIGQNISPGGSGISLDQALGILDDEISALYGKMCHYFRWFLKLNENRQMALINMSFNLGFPGFLKFHKMLAALQEGDTDTAAAEILDSVYLNQVGDRAKRIANIIKTGEI